MGLTPFFPIDPFLNLTEEMVSVLYNDDDYYEWWVAIRERIINKILSYPLFYPVELSSGAKLDSEVQLLVSSAANITSVEWGRDK